MVAAMTHHDFITARHDLGLSQEQLGRALGVHVKTVRRWEAGPDSPYGRAIPAPVARLLEAFLVGYRPDDWPLLEEPGEE